MQNRVIGLPRGKFQRCGDIFGFQIRAIFKYFFARRAGCQQIKDILHPDAQAPDAWSASALIGIYGNTV